MCYVECRLRSSKHFVSCCAEIKDCVIIVKERLCSDTLFAMVITVPQHSASNVRLCIVCHCFELINL